jgi:NAD+ synthase
MELKSKIIKWIKDYSESNGDLKLVVGISGGIDSATVSTLCAETGIETHVVSLPILQSEEQLTLAKKHIDWLKSKYKNIISHEIDLSNIFTSYKEQLIAYDDNLGWANTRSRLRMVTLYLISNKCKGIVVGTGNKIEDFGVGFFTKYGDGAVDISPIADLTKSEVRKLALELRIIGEIIIAKPTDGLWEDDRTDEDQIGATYEELEWAMKYSEEIDDRKLEVLEIYKKFQKQNEHKMKPIPVFYKEPQTNVDIQEENNKKKINVFQEFFIEKNGKRLDEYIFCLNKNLQNNLVERVHLVYNQSEYESNPEYFNEVFDNRLTNTHKLVKIPSDKLRFSFNKVSEYVNSTLPKDSIVFVSNLDIFIPEIESWENIYEEFFNVTDKNICLALARTEFVEEGHTFRDDIAWKLGEFADAWCFKSPFLLNTEDFPYEIPVGNAPTCDNHMFGLLNSKYDEVFNWAEKYVIYHYDIVRKPQVLNTHRSVMIKNPSTVVLPKTYLEGKQHEILHVKPFNDWETILNNLKKQ